MKVWICAIAKMEELYIREWIEWHKQLGIDHIVIGDNNDSDYDKPLQPIIQDYIDEGFVEIINLNNQLGIQQSTYIKVYQERKNEFDWIGFIDIDEFVELPAYNNDIHLFLSDNKFKDTDSIILPWLNYGDNEQLYYEDKPVKERFTKSINQEDACIKYFIKSFDNTMEKISIHNPLNNVFNNKLINTCDSLGNYNIDYKEVDNCITNIYTNIDYYNNAYIAHYITKSTEEYIKYKILRGRETRSIGNYKLRYTIDFYYWINQKNKEKDKLFEIYKQKIINAEQDQLKKYKMI